jgi:hypothetical protein
MANNQLLNVCAAIRSDLARQAQDLAAIRADCRTAADSVAPGVAALKYAISGLAGDGEAGRWVSWGLSGIGAVQVDSACLMLMLWSLGKGRRWILVALLANLVLSPPNGLCWAFYLLATWFGRLMEDYRQRFPWLAACCEGGPSCASGGGVLREKRLVLRFDPGVVWRRGAESAGCGPGGGGGVGVGETACDGKYRFSSSLYLEAGPPRLLLPGLHTVDKY